MKKQILIIENNYAKFFTAKLLLKNKLKLNIKTIETDNVQTVVSKAININPDQIIYCPEGGVVDLLNSLQSNNVNKRNSDVTIIMGPEEDMPNLKNTVIQACKLTPKKPVALAAA